MSEQDPAHRCDLCGDEVVLDDGRLSIRHSDASDGPALADLYRRLDDEDIHRRFFSYRRPSGDFYSHWAGIALEGGFGLVVDVDAGGGDGPKVIAEAGYGNITDGAAELGITVDPDHRGWLGAWLLDSLFRHARANGVAHLDAVVLTSNGPMMAMARKRGYAVVGHPDWGMVHVRMSTSGPVPTWPERHDRPRVLVEARHSRTAAEEAAREAGYDVMLCPGPCHGLTKCPVLVGDACPLIEGADAVIVDLPGTDQLTAQLIHDEAVVHPGTRFISTYRESEGTDAPGMRLPPEELIAQLDELLRTSEQPAGCSTCG